MKDRSMLTRWTLALFAALALQACTPDGQESVRQEERGSAAPDVGQETSPPPVPPPPAGGAGAAPFDTAETVPIAPGGADTVRVQ